MKFGREFKLSISGKEQDWLITNPFTCRFKMTSACTPTANDAIFQLYNLPEKTRTDLIKDVFDGLGEPNSYRRISFAAGYRSQPQLPVIFVGNVFWAYSYRQGPDWITEIHALDGQFGIQNGEVEHAAPAGVEFQALLRTIAQFMPHISIGIISKNVGSDQKSGRGVSVSGNAWDELVKRILPLNAQVFIDKEKMHVITNTEYIANTGGIPEISDETGMIGSPRKQADLTTATMLFEPRIQAGQLVTVKSRESYAGNHKVLFIGHSGTISDAVCETLTSNVTLYRTTEALKAVAL